MYKIQVKLGVKETAGFQKNYRIPGTNACHGENLTANHILKRILVKFYYYHLESVCGTWPMNCILKTSNDIVLKQVIFLVTFTVDIYGSVPIVEFDCNITNLVISLCTNEWTKYSFLNL